jgi:hypothetical protein
MYLRGRGNETERPVDVGCRYNLGYNRRNRSAFGQLVFSDSAPGDIHGSELEIPNAINFKE